MPPIFTGDENLDHIFQLVINDACDLMKPYVLSDYLALRSALRLCCPQMKDLVDSHAPFWNRFIFSPRTTVLAFTDVRVRSQGLPLDITLRVTRDSGLDLGCSSILDNTVERFMARAYGDLSSLFPLCRELILEAASVPVLEIMLQVLSPMHTNSLRTFVLVYPDPITGSVVPSCVSDFVFDERDEPSFPPFTTLTVSRINQPVILAYHTSSRASHASIRQPFSVPLHWSRFSHLLGGSFALSTLSSV
ncbi:hypothetical protein C8R47DRAFT_1297174 [Mycena vitilis]|nr:hypothetical protein C8R47DRAFT_1297174 [Mycena vitilis]